MACLTGEQLARLALGLDEGERLPAHVEACAPCRTKLAEMRRLTGQLSEAHAELDHAHAAARSRLLASLANVEMRPQYIGMRSRLSFRFWRLTMSQRIAAAGVGLSTFVGLVLVLSVFTNSAAQLSAMDRMAKAVREVKSYSYKLFTQDTVVRKGDTHPSTITHTGTTYWLEPKSLLYDEKLVRFEGTAPQGEGKLLSHLTGIHPTGKPGMLIFHAGAGPTTESMVKTYFWVPELPSMSVEDIGKESPITRLRMVREGAGEVLRELGTKLIDGKRARGYVMALKDAKPGSGFDALEVWVDPETDLPLEFGFELRKDGETTGIYRITDCRWNIEIDPKLFDTTPPEGYTDVTAPSDEKAIAEIVAALKLYAELSGGHYPRVTTFDTGAIHKEMLKLARFTGSRQEDWNKLQQIRQATVGLNWIAPVLRKKVNAGYHGAEVRPQDKDKVLLWWRAVDPPGSPDEFSYRVFYGDLRTEVVPLAEWAKRVPSEVAAVYQLPEDDQSPSEDP